MAYIGNIPADKYQTLQKQSFTTSATDTYTLSYAVTNPQDLGLFINNVRQNPNDAYTVSGTTLTLSSAITGSDTMYAVFLGRAVETVAPAIGSVTLGMLSASGTKDSSTFLRGDNTFASAGLSGWSENGSDNDLLPSNANSGIYLGVNSATASNLLDDYEEGTWTPTFGGASTDPSSVSWNIQSGTYTKVGNKVFARAIVYPSSFSGGSGNWNVRGLPFTANANSVGTMMWDRIRVQASYPGGLVPRVLNSTTYMEFPEMNDASDEASVRIQVDDLAGNFYLEFAIEYTTNS
jgi:hypothetical protein